MTWHAHCTAPNCDFVEVDNGYTEDALPEAWTCPQCGGTTHEFVETGFDPAQTIEDRWGEDG